MELRFHAGEITDIRQDDFLQFGVSLAEGTPADREDRLDVRIEQTFTQYAMTDHAGGAEDEGFHEIHVRQRGGAGCSIRVGEVERWRGGEVTCSVSRHLGGLCSSAWTRQSSGSPFLSCGPGGALQQPTVNSLTPADELAL